METSIPPVPSTYRREELPADASQLRIGIFAPPLIEPFQPSLTVPYLAAQMRDLGFSPACHNLSSLFLIWLFRRVRLESMSVYRSLREAIGVLQSPTAFFQPAAYQEALRTLEQYTASLAERDGLPYTLFPGSHPSSPVETTDFRQLTERMEDTLLERFLQDYMGFTLRLETFDVIAFSATNTFQLASSLFIARVLKRAGVPARVFLGGHAATLACKSIEEDRELRACIDSIIVQGGADLFARACADLVRGRLRQLYSLDDVAPRGSGSGFPTDKPYQLVLQHDIQGFYLSPSRVFSVFSALGCSYGACTFCSSNRKNTEYLPRQIGVLVDEIQMLKREYGISRFNVCDNNFDPDRTVLFCRELEQRGLQIQWQCTTRVYETLDAPLLRRMREAGCVMMNVGLESASNRILKIMRKGYSVEQAQQLLVDMEAVGMPVHLYCISGFPSETAEESERTLDFLRRNAGRCHSIYFQDYEAQLAAKVFADALGNETQGYSASRMIRSLMEDEAIRDAFVSKGNLVRRRGYPFIEDHNFLYLAHENAHPEDKFDEDHSSG